MSDVIDLTASDDNIDRPSRLRAGMTVLRSARLTQKRIITCSPCCAARAQLDIEDIRWAPHRPVEYHEVRRCRGCGWPYRLTLVGPHLKPTAIQWEVLRP